MASGHNAAGRRSTGALIGLGRQLRRQEGHMMASVMVGVTIMLILSTVAMQEWSEVLRRDNEAEMIFRAQEIVRAIQKYRTARGGVGPTKLEELMEPMPNTGAYILRRQYEDPLAKDGKWGLLFVGPGNTILDPSNEETGGDTGLSISTKDSSKLNRRREARKGRLGVAAGLLGGGSGQQSGLPIAGVKTLSTDQPFRIYNGLDEYSQWLFTYFDLENPQIPGQQRNTNNPNLNPNRNNPLGNPNSPNNPTNQPTNNP